MKPDQWKRIRSALEQAFELEGDPRAEYLARLEAEDASIAESVRDLLERDADGSIGETPPREAWNRLFDVPVLPAGTRLGPYEVANVIASGGMGTVYSARRADEEFDKAVAIKLIKRGMDSDDVLRRFRYERQVLADLEHPGIARLIDGGVSDEGQPFFVMEFVEGEVIDDWCDSNKLSIRERLRLFQKVCHAVHYAHQRLVVHRDLKPSNILVTNDGEPKLLDFGVARMLDPETEAERSQLSADRGFFGTPSFASPEQVRGERVTTSSDVYSLGVVLYRLLAGKRPYELSQLSRAEAQRLICEVEPTKPSRLLEDLPDSPLHRARTRLVGDLDNIVLMALRKEPERRYASAEQFAEDIGRHLDGMPVMALPNTFGYRAAKFLRRNRASSVIGAALILSLFGGIVTGTRLYRAAVLSNEKAVERLEDARRLAATFIFEVSGDIGPLEGTVRARERIVRSALEYLDQLALDSENDPGVRLDLANAYLRLGDLQGGAVRSNLGQRDKARASYERASEMAEALSAEAPDSQLYSELTARCLLGHADLDLIEGNVTSFNERLELALSLCPAESSFPAVLETRATILTRLGDWLISNGEAAQALPKLLESVGIQEGLREEDLGSARRRRDFALACNKLSEAYLYAGEVEQAEGFCLQACAEMLALFETEPEDSESRQLLATTHFSLGTLYVRTSRFEEAIEPLQVSTEQARILVDADPNNDLAQRNRVAGLHTLGAALTQLGRLEESVEVTEEALLATRSLMEKAGSSLKTRRDYAIGCSSLAGSLTRLGRLEEAVEYNEQALAEFEALRDADPDRGEVKRDLAACLTTIGGYHMGAGKDEARSMDERREHADRALECFGKALDELTELESVGKLAKVDEPFLGMLSRFVGDAESLGAFLRDSN